VVACGVGYDQAMRRLVATILLIPSARKEQWTGMTAIAVIFVTTDPPTLLVGVNETASLRPVVEERGALDGL
jgi:flavin reductase